jgi:phosphoglycolate phosphatase-like HAD superfamily hydrolase
VKLLIFDIDGTLTHLDGATSRAFASAFERLFHVENSCTRVPMHGRTDPVIFMDYFERNGLQGNWQEAYAQFCVAYIEVLPQFIAATPMARLHSGVPELLHELERRRESAALALGTGNMEAGARKKIGHFDLNRYFPVGGFGDSHHERSGIMRDAVRNAEAYYQTVFDPSECWVIGDTIYDIEGGKALGLKTLGVATGGAFSAEQLHASGADVVFEDLSDTVAVLTAFGVL